jgi:hypothetical protein
MRFQLLHHFLELREVERLRSDANDFVRRRKGDFSAKLPHRPPAHCVKKSLTAVEKIGYLRPKRITRPVEN